jgi:hypothetical protein
MATSMNSIEYHTRLHRLRERSVPNLSELAEWGDSEALPWLWQELAGIVGKKRLAPVRPYNAIRNGLQTTPTDRYRMPTMARFYIAQLTMLDGEAKRYCSAVKRFVATTEPFAGNAALVNLHDGLIDLFTHGINLFEQAAHLLLNLPGVYGGWSRRVETPIEVFKGAEQIIYGQFSGLTHIDRAPFTPVSVIRTAIEIRFRSAFGIYAHFDQSNHRVRAIDMSQLADEIQRHLSHIKFDVDFHDTMKIYRWSNPYLHAGWRDFVWVPGFALRFLRPLFFRMGEEPNGSWSLNGSIQMTRETWRAIRDTFQNAGADRGLILNPAEESDAACTFLN